MKAIALHDIQLLTVEQTADKLGLCPRTIRRLIERGELVAHRINRTLRVDATSVMRLLETTRVVASDETDPCPGSESSPQPESHTSSVVEARLATGPGTFTAARSRSEPLMPKKRSDASESWPANAAELRQALRGPRGTPRARSSRSS